VRESSLRIDSGSSSKKLDPNEESSSDDESDESDESDGFDGFKVLRAAIGLRGGGFPILLGMFLPTSVSDEGSLSLGSSPRIALNSMSFL
jgi:hypothetical protein